MKPIICQDRLGTSIRKYFYKQKLSAGIDLVTNSSITKVEKEADGAKTPFLCHFVLKPINYQDRLGTDMEKKFRKHGVMCRHPHALREHRWR
jgi:hypothetical protein